MSPSAGDDGDASDENRPGPGDTQTPLPDAPDAVREPPVFRETDAEPGDDDLETDADATPEDGGN